MVMNTNQFADIERAAGTAREMEIPMRVAKLGSNTEKIIGVIDELEARLGEVLHIVRCWE